MTIFRGTKHDDDFSGTSGDDTYLLYKGGDDEASGGDGNDLFKMGAALNAGDRIDGGAGRDVVFLNGDYSAGLTFSGATIQRVEVLRLGNGFDYDLTLDDLNTAFRSTLTINAAPLGAADHAVIDGSKETDGFFTMIGGAGDDTLIVANAAVMHGTSFDGGAGNDTLLLRSNNTTFTLGAGALTNVENLVLHGSFIGAVASDIAGGTTLNVDLSGADFAVFDGSAETDGHFHFVSGSQNDTMRGGQGDDSFDMTGAAGGGSLGAYGNGGNDLFLFGDNFGDSAMVNGGAGSDTVELDGDYSTGQAFTSYAMTGIETLKLDAGNSYDLTTHNSNVVAGQTLTVDASALGASDTLAFNGAAESNGFFAITGGAGDDSVTLGAHFNAGDSFDGGAGSDTLELKGDYSSPLFITALTNVETLKLDNGFSYNLGAISLVDDGATLTVDASALTAGHTLTFDGFTAGHGHLVLVGGAGNDVLEGSNHGTTFVGGMGADLITGNDEDTFVYNAAAESTGAGGHDTIISFGDAHFSLAGAHVIDAVNPTAGTAISAATFDADLQNGADGHLGPRSAATVHATGGDLMGHTFLVVDVDGNNGYEPGTDYVIDVTSYFGSIDPDTFI